MPDDRTVCFQPQFVSSPMKKQRLDIVIVLTILNVTSLLTMLFLTITAQERYIAVKIQLYEYIGLKSKADVLFWQTQDMTKLQLKYANRIEELEKELEAMRGYAQSLQRRKKR